LVEPVVEFRFRGLARLAVLVQNEPRGFPGFDSSGHRLMTCDPCCGVGMSVSCEAPFPLLR